jgi:hypothetical protein
MKGKPVVSSSSSLLSNIVSTAQAHQIKKREKNQHKYSSVTDPDPGSGAFLTSGSGIRNKYFRFPDLGSQTHVIDSFMTNF